MAVVASCGKRLTRASAGGDLVHVTVRDDGHTRQALRGYMCVRWPQCNGEHRRPSACEHQVQALHPAGAWGGVARATLLRVYTISSHVCRCVDREPDCGAVTV